MTDSSLGKEDPAWEWNVRCSWPKHRSEGNSHHGNEIWKIKKAIGRNDKRYGKSSLQKRNHSNEVSPKSWKEEFLRQDFNGKTFNLDQKPEANIKAHNWVFSIVRSNNWIENERTWASQLRNWKGPSRDWTETSWDRTKCLWFNCLKTLKASKSL